jgi:integrase
MFSFGTQMGYCLGNPCDRIGKLPEEKRIKYVPPLEDFLKVLAVADPITEKMLKLQFLLAARPGEIDQLKWEDVEEDGIIIRSRKHRNGEMRENLIPLSPVANECLNQLPRERKEYIFYNPKTRSCYLRHPKLMKILCQKAGVKYFGRHTIRHLAASTLLDKKTDLKTIQELLRHSKLTTTQTYLHSLKQSQIEAVKGLDECLNNRQNVIEYSIKNPNIIENGDKNQ